MLLSVWWDAPLSLGRVECLDIVQELTHTHTLMHTLSAPSPGDSVPFIEQEPHSLSSFLVVPMHKQVFIYTHMHSQGNVDKHWHMHPHTGINNTYKHVL